MWPVETLSRLFNAAARPIKTGIRFNDINRHHCVQWDEFSISLQWIMWKDKQQQVVNREGGEEKRPFQQQQQQQSASAKQQLWLTPFLKLKMMQRFDRKCHISCRKTHKWTWIVTQQSISEDPRDLLNPDPRGAPGLLKKTLRFFQQQISSRHFSYSSIWYGICVT